MLEGPPFRRILTISELTAAVRGCLEQAFESLWVEGEVSNVRTPGSGHLYLTLKDEKSQIRTVLFRSSAQHLPFALREGLQVIARGRLTVYEPRGDYQLVLEYLEPKGVGSLQIAFDQLKEKLESEGLFDPSRKRALPFLPRRVGVVTSLSGAAIRDILTVLRRRCPLLGVIVDPVPVQGEGAAAQIAEAILRIGRLGQIDVLIVGRGGGSLEDLWCFNDERVVRAIAECRVPVVSAVGHEIDYTLADFAADYRAPTPSAAAETVAPLLSDLLGVLQDRRLRLQHAVDARVRMSRQRVQWCRRALPHPVARLQRLSQRLDELETRLGLVSLHKVSLRRHRVGLLCSRLVHASPIAPMRRAQVIVPQLVLRAQHRIQARLQVNRQRILALGGALDTLSPLATLSRGYSIVHRLPGGEILRRARDVVIEEQVRVRLAEGELICKVRDIHP